MSVRQTVYNINRRDLFKLASAGTAAGFMLDFDELFAQGKCDKIDSSPDFSKAGTFSSRSFSSLAATPFYYWIDGTMGALENSTLKRARLAAYLDLSVGVFSWVDGVLLTDSTNVIIAAQRFTQGDVSPHSGKSPYVIFENIEFAAQSTYYLYFLVRSGKEVEKVAVYKHELTPQKLQNSRLDYKHLDPTGNTVATLIAGVPKKFRDEMLASHGLKLTDNTLQKGTLTTSLHGFDAPTFKHPVRAALGDLSNNDFEIRVFPMHAEQSAGHYMRNIAVLDPVGRVLGLLRREFNGATLLPENSELLVKKGLMVQEAVVGSLAAHFSQDEKDFYTKTGAPSILDCPYVHVIIDDVAEAIGKTTLRLR